MLIIDDDEKYAAELTSHARLCGDFLDVSYALDGEEGFRMFQLLKPDIIILDAVMPKLDGIGFLRRLKNFSNKKKPVIIMNSHSQLTSLLRTAAEYGIDYFMVKPQSYREICRTVYDFTAESEAADNNISDSKTDELEKNVTLFLRKLGIPAHLSGYRYIRSAIMMTSNDLSLLSPITKKLYPMIADTYKTTKCCVERAMRHAIGVSWKRGNKKLLNDIFGYSSDNHSIERPTNSEYLAMAVDDFRLRVKHGMLQ